MPSSDDLAARMKSTRARSTTTKGEAPTQPPAARRRSTKAAGGGEVPVPPTPALWQPERRTPAFRQAPRTYPHRITLDLDDDRYERLREAAYRLRVPATALLRSLVDLAATDDATFEAVRELLGP